MPTKRAVSETVRSASAATTNPIGPASDATVITDVITFGRSAAGVRTVSTPMIGAFTSGAKNPKHASTTIAASQGIGTESSHSGSGIATIATAASLSRSAFCASCCATIAPHSAPTPNAPKRKPTTCASCTGLSRGAIFNYFGSKQDLFIELALATSIRYGNLVLERGLEPAIRAVAEEDPDWLGVLFEMDARLRHDPEFLRRLEAAQEDESPRIVDWFAARQADGTFRDDVGARDLGRFATIVLNGFALRVLAGGETDVDALLQLLDDALAPRK